MSKIIFMYTIFSDHKNFVIAETFKSYYNNDEDLKLFYYCDDEKTEVDLINLDNKNKYELCEIKSTTLYNEKFKKHLLKVAKYLNTKATNYCIVYGGQGSFKDEEVQIIDFNSWSQNLYK